VDLSRREDAPDRLGGSNGRSDLIPNQVPNSFESDRAFHTRERGARSRILFSMESVLMCNLPDA
jgi:hypothetical protein